MPTRKIEMTGQLFADDGHGPMFCIWSIQIGDRDYYGARVTSPLTGEVLAADDGFVSFGKAADWTQGHCNW